MVKHSREYDEDMFLKLSREINALPSANKLSLKWGVYRIIDRSVSAEQMCDRVMLASDSIKSQYLRHFAVYDDTLRDKLLREQAMIDDMAGALEEEQFAVYFQPKWRLADGSFAGAEALVRWIHPERGFISPGEFIPLFEKNGFITRLDRFVWEQACLCMREWKKKGCPCAPISVNVSRADFYQEHLIEVLEKLLQKYDLSAEDLHLEVTETAYTENPKQIMNTVDELRKRGFVVELDDFGSGYSSLNMLNEMNLDIIKLDVKFVQSETAKPAEEGILRFIVHLAHWKKLKVVAEGIETQEQMVRLKEMGCDYAQGYFFAKPMPGPEFERMLSETKQM